MNEWKQIQCKENRMGRQLLEMNEWETNTTKKNIRSVRLNPKLKSCVRDFDRVTPRGIQNILNSRWM